LRIVKGSLKNCQRIAKGSFKDCQSISQELPTDCQMISQRLTADCHSIYHGCLQISTGVRVCVSFYVSCRGRWNDKQQFAQRWFAIFSLCCLYTLGPCTSAYNLLLCNDLKRFYPKKSHTNYTSKNTVK
jgi:hypothetical protein